MEAASKWSTQRSFVATAISVGCSAAPTQSPSRVVAAPEVGGTSSARLRDAVWFQPNGSIVAFDAEGRQSPELSAPIVPCVLALNRDGFYPPEREAREQMADEASLTFAYFQQACAGRYPIARAGGGEILTSERARDNYASVARCSFETHYGKPYWVPQLLDDVDLCARELGSSWQLPNEETFARFNTRHRELLAEALHDVPYGGGYNSLSLYARDGANKLTVIALGPPRAHGGLADPVRLTNDPRRTL